MPEPYTDARNTKCVIQKGQEQGIDGRMAKVWTGKLTVETVEWIPCS